MTNKSFQQVGTAIVCVSLVVACVYISTQASETSAFQQNSKTQAIPAATTHTKQQASQATWGKSPFEVGYENVEIAAESTQKSASRPNLIWPKQTFTLKDGRTLTYEFGKGNPVEVAMTDEQIKTAYKSCWTPADPKGEGSFCPEGAGYVSELVERNLLLALANPNWDTLLTKCAPQLSASFSPNFPAFILFSDPQYRNINNWLTLDSITGRKTLDVGKVLQTMDWLRVNTYEWTTYVGDTSHFTNPTCVDVEGREISRHFNIALLTYLRKPGVFWPLPKGLFSPKKFKFTL